MADMAFPYKSIIPVARIYKARYYPYSSILDPALGCLFWNKLWVLHIPSKVKNLFRRICNGCVPVRGRLIQQGLEIDGNCPLCNRELEFMTHAFVSCSFAHDCWPLVLPGVIEIFQLLNTESMFEWLLNIFIVHGEADVEFVCLAFWVIWKHRNSILWNNSDLSAAVPWSQASNWLHEWQ